ncbi:CPBP family intramembrane metalloprotease [Sphingomonas sp. JC676]|uniref:CPBP family intramembrane glutamic endopeptidase n=1 Tax=Sphingomonas sp. JC676 TaxID=2768065 RepID=UPI001657B421|nr:type II CAAX endopeptidase family protein [Sphingomonas sp. JC676]MBC9032270.1 CPBP family intramembrane metalloprotease [Sphingomonas sp. JC676]
MRDHERWGDVGTFLGLAIAISCIFYALILSTGAAPAGRYYVTGLMWTPGVAALLTVRLRGLDMASLGLGWGEGRWALTGYLVPLGYTLVAYAAVWILGFGGFADQANVAALADTLGWKDTAPALVILGYFALMATSGFVIALTGGLGEELGWRGLLAPRMMGALGFTGTALVVGVIWTAWHLPLLLFGSYNQGTPWWVSVPCFAVLVLSISVILTWLRMRSNSVWPCAIFHASHNIFVQAVFTPLTGARGAATPYAIGEFGVAVPAALVLVATWFWMKRKEAVAAV